MASTDSINLDRSALADFLPSPRAIKAFETLANAEDATSGLSGDNALNIETLQADAIIDSRNGLAALIQAESALTLAEGLEGALMQSHIAHLYAEIADLRRQINDLKLGPTP